MAEKSSEEKFFIIPQEDGSTAIIYNSKREKVPDEQVFRTFPDFKGHWNQELLEQYMTLFPEETKLKVALFEEMLRAVPNWMEPLDMEPWYRNLVNVASRSISINKKLRTRQEYMVLEWLLLTLSEPKLREIHTSSYDALLELTEEKTSVPSKAYIVEYSEGKTNNVSYGFFGVDPGDVISLVYGFEEAGRGRHFWGSLSTALEMSSKKTFSLWGRVSPRYKCILMLEFLSHPGVVPVEQLQERSSYSGLLQNPGTHKVTDTTQARVMAVLLFHQAPKSRPKRPNRIIIYGMWILLAIHAAFSFYRANSLWRS